MNFWIRKFCDMLYLSEHDSWSFVHDRFISPYGSSSSVLSWESCGLHHTSFDQHRIIGNFFYRYPMIPSHHPPQHIVQGSRAMQEILYSDCLFCLYTNGLYRRFYEPYLWEKSSISTLEWLLFLLLCVHFAQLLNPFSWRKTSQLTFFISLFTIFLIPLHYLLCRPLLYSPKLLAYSSSNLCTFFRISYLIPGNLKNVCLDGCQVWRMLSLLLSLLSWWLMSAPNPWRWPCSKDTTAR